jgi:3-oxoisoapionate decarboxylase
VRDAVVFEHPRGAVVQWVALGDGSIDYGKFFERYRQLCPGVAVQLEILTGSAPQVLPYLEPDYWKAFPKARAAEFARFVALSRQGHPFMGSMVVGGRGERPPEYSAAFKEQQRIDLERSFDYAKKVLKLGLRA